MLYNFKCVLILCAWESENRFLSYGCHIVIFFQHIIHRMFSSGHLSAFCQQNHVTYWKTNFAIDELLAEGSKCEYVSLLRYLLVSAWIFQFAQRYCIKEYSVYGTFLLLHHTYSEE